MNAFPVEITPESICAYVKPVENFLDRLYLHSKNNPEKIFRKLYKVLTWPRLLTYAALRVLGNKGAYTAGIDNESKNIFMRTFKAQINCIQGMLKDEYQPSLVVRTYIPKKNGKTRPLGIATLRDRVIQEALRLVLEAIYEPAFVDESHGYRPGKSTQTAMKDCMTLLQPGKKMSHVLEFDIKAFFCSVDHKIMLKLISKKVHDRKLKILIWRIMRTPVLDGKCVVPNKKGVPQGGVLSPLLSSIYLHEFDKFVLETIKYLGARKYLVKRKKNGRVYHQWEWKRKKPHLNGGTFGYIRYSDDSVGFWNGRIQDLYKIKDLCGDFLKKELKLELSEEKTLITNIEKGFKFVGFHFKKGRVSKSIKETGKVIKAGVVSIPKESLKRTVSKITETCQIASKRGYDQPYTILKINQVLRGFYNYFANTTLPAKGFIKVFDHALKQYWYYLKRKGIKRRRRFKQSRDGYLTMVSGKYFIATPPRAGPITRSNKTTHKGLVDIEYLDNYLCRRKRVRIRRLIPNDPIVPLNGNWRVLRKQAFARDGGKCAYCGDIATQVHHIFTKSEARFSKEIRKERNKLKFLRSICKSCHRRRHGGIWSWDYVMEYIESFNEKHDPALDACLLK